MRTVYLDTETTGLNPALEEVLEIGILDDTGAVLLDTLVRPVRRLEWPEAQRIHGITPAAVAEAPTLAELRPRIVAAVTGTRVVIYNAPFDSGFLAGELAAASEVVCAMRLFAEAFGEWDDRRGSWHWQKLHVAAAHVGFSWPGSAHRAIHDCAAARAVWRWLQDRSGGSPPLDR